MPLYHYQKSSLVESVTVKRQRVGYSATILLKDGAPPVQIEKLIQQLGDQDIPTLVDVVEGKPAIQICGIRKPEKLLLASDVLAMSGHDVRTESIPEDKKEKKSFGEMIRGSAFLISALFYDIGNALFLISGFQRGKHNPDHKFTGGDISEMGIGAAFSAGDILMTAYGRENGSEEIAAASEGLRKHFARVGIKLPGQDTLNPDASREYGPFQKIHAWLHRNIIYIKCLAETTGGALMVKSGFKVDKDTNSRNPQKIGAGVMIVLGWLTTALLEKPRGHKIFDVERDTAFSPADAINRNPRGWLARPAALSNNVLNIWGAFRERQKKKGTEGANDYIWNLISSSSFLTANSLFGLSGSKRKQDPQEDKKLQNNVILMAANALMSDDNLNEIKINEAAEYVTSKLARVKMTREDAAKAISEKISSLKKLSWTQQVQQPAPEAVSSMAM